MQNDQAEIELQRVLLSLAKNGSRPTAVSVFATLQQIYQTAHVKLS